MRAGWTITAIRPRRLAGLYVATAAYIAVRVVAVAGAPPFGLGAWADTAEYLDASHHSLLSSSLWAGLRSPTVPLFYKLFHTMQLMVVGQVALSIVAWLVLAAAVSRSMRHRWVGLLAYVIVLLFSIVPWVSQWDTGLVSESVTLSLTALIIATYIGLVRRPTGRNVGTLLVLMLLWALSRDSNASEVLFAIPLAAIWLLRTSRRRLAAITLVGLVAIVALTITSADVGQRSKRPLIENIEKRILPNPSAFTYFKRHGMPLPADIRVPLTTHWFPDYAKLYTETDWPRFDHWLDTKGQSTYTSWLIDNPGKAISIVWHDRSALSSVSPNEGPTPNLPLALYRPTGFRYVLPAAVDDVLYPTTGTIVLLYVLVGLNLLAFVAWRHALPRVMFVPLAVATLAVPHAVAVALSEPMETTRHTLVAGLTLRLACWLIALFALDGWLSGSSADGEQRLRQHRDAGADEPALEAVR